MIWPFRRRSDDEDEKQGAPGESRVTRYTVPDDFSTLGEAIESAREGSTISVRPGRYRENLDFAGKSVSLVSENPEDPDTVRRTIIDGTGRGSVIVFASGEDERASLRGFTITGGRAEMLLAPGGGGIVIRNESCPRIEHNVICDNESDLDGGGIFVDDSWPVIRRNTITGNTADGSGGGIHIGRDSNIVSPEEVDQVFAQTMLEAIEESRIETTQISALDSDADFTIRDFINVGPEEDVQREERTRPVIEGNTITGNAALAGGGIFISDEAPVLESNAIRENRARRGAGVCLWDNCRAVLTGNFIGENMADTEGGGLIVEWGASPVLSKNRIVNNAAPRGPALSVAQNSAPLVHQNHFQNRHGDAGQSVHFWALHLAVMRDNHFEGADR